ncbi:MAG: ferrous iron transport protein A [Crocinitomicaceae bacterium]|nr:ferrous iron transport protein A [Crocinitomicaceae bacterium]
MKLSTLEKYFTGTIIEILEGSFSAKLFEFGILPGASFTLIGKAPFNGPVYIKVDDSLIALRKSEADCILVK